MIPVIQEQTENKASTSFATATDSAARSHILRLQNEIPKSIYKIPVSSQSANLLTLERSSAQPKYPDSVLSKKVSDALAEDPDPAKSLADIRRVLVGPTRQLQEARMEEVITILEESDRVTQASLRSLENQCANLAAITERQAVEAEETRQKIERQSEHMDFELQNTSNSQQQMLSELFVMFDSKLETISTQLTQQIDTLAAKTSQDLQTLVNEVAQRIQDVAAAASDNDAKLVEQFETRLVRAEAYTDKEHRRHIAVFADGFSDIADRLLALRGVQAS